MNILDKYPEIERPLRGDGSPEARRRCLKPVIELLPKFLPLIEEIQRIKNIKFIKIFVFQSRAAGTCKPDADFDFYVQVAPEYKQMVLDDGVLYKDTGVKLICGEWATNFFSTPDPSIIERMRHLKLDVFMGIEPVPPAKKEYRGEKYYVNLDELKDMFQ